MPPGYNLLHLLGEAVILGDAVDYSVYNYIITQEAFSF